MPIRGVNPSYFAGMPTYQLDPDAFKGNPQYAQLLSNAMQNNALMAAKRGEEDRENRFKAVEQAQKAEEILRTDRVNKRLAGAKEAEQRRLQAGQDFEQDRLKTADTEHLLEGLRRAQLEHNQRAAAFYAEELKRRGFEEERSPTGKYVPPEERGKEPGKAGATPPAVVDRSPPRPPPPTARFADAAGASAAPPMKVVPAGTPTARFAAPGNGGAVPPASAAPSSPVVPPAPAFTSLPAPAADPTQKKLLDEIVEGLARDKARRPPAPASPPRDAGGYGEGWEQVLRNTGGDTSGASLSPARSRMPGINAPAEASAQAVPPPPPPLPPDTSAYGRSWDQMWADTHVPTDKELLDRAIAEVVARESGQAPPAKPLLPGQTIGLSPARIPLPGTPRAQ